MSPDDAIVLFAEVSVALAGFAGVASALSGRNREFALLDRGRILAILGLSAIVLAGCLAYISASLGEGSAEQATRVAALASLIACIPVHAWVVIPAVRDLNRSDSEAEPWVIHLSTALVIMATLAYAWVVVFPANIWLLAGSFSLQIVHTLWMFLRLLTRPTQLGR